MLPLLFLWILVTKGAFAQLIDVARRTLAPFCYSPVMVMAADERSGLAETSFTAVDSATVEEVGTDKNTDVDASLGRKSTQTHLQVPVVAAITRINSQNTIRLQVPFSSDATQLDTQNAKVRSSVCMLCVCVCQRERMCMRERERERKRICVFAREREIRKVCLL